MLYSTLGKTLYCNNKIVSTLKMRKLNMDNKKRNEVFMKAIETIYDQYPGMIYMLEFMDSSRIDICKQESISPVFSILFSFGVVFITICGLLFFAVTNQKLKMILFIIGSQYIEQHSEREIKLNGETKIVKFFERKPR